MKSLPCSALVYTDLCVQDQRQTETTEIVPWHPSPLSQDQGLPLPRHPFTANVLAVGDSPFWRLHFPLLRPGRSSLAESTIHMTLNPLLEKPTYQIRRAKAWRRWREDTVVELIDPTLRESCPRTEVIRCIHIGLLCVQENVASRPTMASIILMLNSNFAPLPAPSLPAFLMHSRSTTAGTLHSLNEASITELHPR